MTQNSTSEPVLTGLLVVTIEQAVAAPLCSMRLADAGARVIKIEPKTGETARHYDDKVDGHSAYFASLNRGKESICLDLKSPDDFALLENMLSEADVFVRNTGPGAMARLGLGGEELRQRYSSLITLDIVGYGQDTEYRDMKAYDLLVQAESGLCAVTGTADTPCKVGVSVADMGSGMNAYAAILEALMAREKTGQGKFIEIAMFDCVAEWMSVPLLHFEHTGSQAKRLGLAHASIYPYRPYRCVDGEVIIAVQNPDQWQKFCSLVMRQPDMENDPRFHTNALRVENRDPLDAWIEETTLTLKRSEMVDRLEQAGIAYGRLSTLEDLSRHKALRRQEIDNGGKPLSVVSSPIAPLPASPPKLPMLDANGSDLRSEFG